MKNWLVLTVFSWFVTQNAFAGGSTLFSTDHAAHYGISFVATELGYAVGEKTGLSRFQSWAFSALLVNAAGVVKETAIDKQSDMNDIYSNMAGSVSAGLFVWTFDF